MRPGTALLVILPFAAVVSAFLFVSARGGRAGAAEGGLYWPDDVANFVRGRVARTYVDEVDEARAAEAFHAAMDAYVRSLDAYCDFIPPEEHQLWEEDTSGEYAGLGIKVQALEDVDGLTIMGILPGGPAAEAGLSVGDVLLSANGQSLVGLGIDELQGTRILKGEPGSIVRVTIHPHDAPDGVTRDVDVRRAVIRPPSVFSRRVGDDGRFGVIRLTEFAEATEQDFDRALTAMLEGPRPIQGLVLDVRGNPGGVLPTAVAIVNRFISRGVIVRMEGRAQNARRVYDADAESTRASELPLVVLVNGTSASASEVVAGALQDHRRALLVGERTYGKFLVQQITEVPGYGAALQLTTSRYYLPSGRSYQRSGWDARGRGSESDTAGILPDIPVPMTDEQVEQLLRTWDNEEAVPWGEAPPHTGDETRDFLDPQLAEALALLDGDLALRRIRGSGR